MSAARTIESAATALLGRDGSGERRTPSSGVFTGALMVVFFLVMMICLTAGVSLYRNVAAMQARENNLRMQSGLMASIVHMTDMADAVEVADGPQGDALVLVEHLASGTYETRLYLLDGTIVQEYAIAGRDLNPENAIAIMDSEIFEFSFDGRLLTLVTDQGASRVAFRSTQEGAVASTGFDAALSAAPDIVGAGDAS